MKPYRHLTDDDLIEIGNAFVGDLSYYYAGWDYPDSARREDNARRKCERQARKIGAELKRRGLRTTRAGLTSLGVRDSD